MNSNIKICFVASSGGHLEQILMLKPLEEKYNCVLITEKTQYALLLPFKHTYLIPQMNRKEPLFILKFIRQHILAWRILHQESPRVIISTGALSAFPFCLLGKLMGSKIIFIESFAKIHSRTLTGRFVYKFADLFIIQWNELSELYPNAVYGGSIY